MRVFRVIDVCVKCLICKCDANAAYQSALSHLEEGVEIIHESRHLSRSLSKLSVELWRKTSDLCWETHRDPSSSPLPLFISSFFLAEDSVSCENPGLPDNGYQILSKRLYLPGESLTFVCYQGYELIGEVAIKCILGNPSFWSGPLPLCRGENFAEFVCVEWNDPLFSVPLDFCTYTIFFRLLCSLLVDTAWSCSYACIWKFAKPLFPKKQQFSHSSAQQGCVVTFEEFTRSCPLLLAHCSITSKIMLWILIVIIKVMSTLCRKKAHCCLFQADIIISSSNSKTRKMKLIISSVAGNRQLITFHGCSIWNVRICFLLNCHFWHF